MGAMDSLKNKVAIVGAADTEVGVVPHLSATQLYVKAAKLALDDAGMTKNDQVDGLITCVSFVEPYHVPRRDDRRVHADLSALLHDGAVAAAAPRWR